LEQIARITAPLITMFLAAVAGLDSPCVSNITSF
jgi:hypothetical protein